MRRQAGQIDCGRIELAQQCGGEGAVVARRTVERDSARGGRVERQPVDDAGRRRALWRADDRCALGLRLALAVGGIVAAGIVDHQTVAGLPGGLGDRRP